MRSRLILAAVAALAAAPVAAQTTPYAPRDDYRDQRALPAPPPAGDAAARAAWEQARGEAYHRAPDSAQTEAELAATRALNAEIVAQNDLAAKQEEADRLAYDTALARHQVEVEQTEARARSAAEAARAAQAQYDRDYAAWEARVRACQAGDRAACAPPPPR